MGKYEYKTTGRTNFKGGKKNSGGSHLIGWDNGKVRAERYTFRTGKWPVSKIYFWYNADKFAGSKIAIRCAISTNSTANVKKSGKSGGHAVSNGGKTTITCSLKANTTYYIVFYPGVSTYGLLKAQDKFTVYQTTIDRTACTAPTSLVLSRTLQSTGKTVDLSWSGAAAGNNVQIASYEIYYSTARDGTYQRLFETETITNTTHKVTAPAQGQTHFYKILVKSNPAGYDSPLSAAIDVGLTGNVIPIAPTIVEVSNILVPSTGGQIKFRVNPGNTYSGTKSLYYCTSQSDKKIRFDSPLVVDVQQQTTYYFYTYDNIDFSTSASQTISVNVKPKITAAGCTASGPTVYNALGGNGADGYQLGYANKVTPVISASKTGKVKVALEFYSSNNTDPWDNSNVQSVPMQTVDITSATNMTLNECLIHKGVAAAFGSTNIHWRLSFVINDGLEDSDVVYFPSGLNSNNEIEYEGKYYAIAHAPSLIAKFNRFDTSDIPGTKVGEICDKIRFEINKDTSMADINVTAISEGNGITIKSVTSTFSDDPQLQYINVTLDNSSIKGGADIKFTVNLSDEDGYLIKTVTGITNVKETKVPAIAFPNELSYGATTINPFTSSGAFTISAAWPFGSYDMPEALPEYNCSTTQTDVIKLVYEDESGEHTVKKAPTWSKQNDTITTSLNRQNVYEWNHSLGYDIYAGVKKYRCRLEITNLFDVTYATPWVDCEFDFNEPAVSPTISKIYWSPDETDWAELDTSSQSTQAIQKGMYIKFECDFGLYTTDATTVSILVETDNLIEREVHFYDAAKGPSGGTTPITYTNQELSRGDDYLSYGENHRNYIYQITEEISSIDIRKWKLKITSESDKKASSAIVETKVLRQSKPDIEFIQCKVDKDYKVDYTFKINNLGGGTLRYCLCDEDGNKQALSDLTSVGFGTTTGNITIDPTPTPPWDSRNISIEIESTVTQTIGTTQFTHVETYYSIPILAYHVTPTIAYRTNSLGINVENPAAGAMVDIHQTAGKSIVLVQGRDSSSNPTKFVMNPTTGAIQFYTWDSTIGTEGDYRLLHTLDLSRGAIDPTP